MQPGTQLAHYEILEPIGKGGMGEVYRARDGKLGRDVAIKVLPDEFAQDEERLRRFQREAKVLASLNHPNIAAIYGLEESAGTHFLVLELVPGETLGDRISRSPIPIDEALEIASKIAEALEEAHEHGIVHRDLKPANVKLTEDGKVKVLDFGLAKATTDETAPADDSMSPTITRDATRAGVILGTAAYMSPEQAKGKRVDKRTDIFAFGAVLYEMLTGSKAFAGADVSETLASVIRLEPDWNQLPASSPAALRRLLRRCLEKYPRQRLHDIADARLEIEESRSEPPESSGAAAEWRSKAIVVMTLAAVLLGGLFVWSLLRSQSPVTRSVTRSVIPVQSSDELEPYITTFRTPSVAISPDGRYIAYVARHGESTWLYLRALDRMEAQPIDGSENCEMPFFSPDSQWLGFVAGGKLKKVSVSGGAPVTIAATGQNVRGASWSSDGFIILSQGTTAGLSRISADGGEPEILTIPDRERGEKAHRLPEVLPDGKAVLFTITPGEIESFDDASIAVLSLETGDYEVVLEGGTNPRYSQTGHLVYARAGSLLAVSFDLDTRRVTGAPVSVLEGVTTNSIYGAAEFSVSRNGQLLYAPGESWRGEHRVLWVDREGRAEPLLETRRAFNLPRLSPDGRLLALDVDGANISLWIYDLARDTLSRFATGFDNDFPVWSPDGRRVAFASTRLGAWNLFWKVVDGSGDVERLSSGPYDQFSRSWSPDGKSLAFDERHPGTGWNIWLLSTEGDRKAEPLVATGFNEQHAMFSPDGRWIAYTSDESGQNEIYLRSLRDSRGRRQVSNGGGEWPVWNSNGKELFYLNEDRMMVVDVETAGELSLGKPRTLFERGTFVVDYDVTPDGKRFVMVEAAKTRPRATQLVLVQNWGEELKRLVATDN